MSLPETVQTGLLLESLEAVRDEIAADLEACSSMRDKAALYSRLVDVLTRIDELRPDVPKGDSVDEIAARRAARRTAPAPRPPRANRSG